MTASSSSLRERSKAKRRVAIQRAAMRLFAERGYDGATLAEIAEQAEVAPRTVSMYFPSKLDIAMSTSTDIAGRLLATFQEHPELPFTEVLDRWLSGESEATDPELAKLTTAMFVANPALRAVSTTHFADVTKLAGPSFIAESGLDPADPIVPIVGAAVGAVITAYLSTSPSAGGDWNLHDSVMRYLRALVEAAKPD